MSRCKNSDAGPGAFDVDEGDALHTRLVRAWREAAQRTKLPLVTSLARQKMTMVLALAVLRCNVPGDFVEAGVLRGGTSLIMMDALRAADKQRSRHMWSCDSFEGLPDTHAADADCGRAGMRPGAQFTARSSNSSDCTMRWGRGAFKAPKILFEANLLRYYKLPLSDAAALESRHHVVPGWFNESLPPAGLSRIAFLRIDSDLYESTRDSLTSLFPLVSPGGLVYVDDYQTWPGVATAVDEFLASGHRRIQLHHINEVGGQGILKNTENTARTNAVWFMKPLCEPSSAMGRLVYNSGAAEGSMHT